MNWQCAWRACSVLSAAALFSFSGCAIEPTAAEHAIPITEIAITPYGATLEVGQTQQFVATITLRDGDIRLASNFVIWASDIPEVAEVSNDEGSQGLVTALSEGVTQITATLTAEELSSSVVVTVGGPLAPPQ